jgi:hypothetical protein
MTILQMVVILFTFCWVLRIPREPVRERELSRRSCR